jgi:hypothetical protein
LDATNDLFKISKENFNVISLFEYMVQRWSIWNQIKKVCDIRLFFKK